MLFMVPGKVHEIHKLERLHDHRHRECVVLYGSAESIHDRGGKFTAHGRHQLGGRFYVIFVQVGRLSINSIAERVSIGCAIQ